MKSIYNVTYRVSDDIWSANVVIADCENDIRAAYADEPGVRSDDDIIIRDGSDYDVEDARRRGKPVVTVPHVEPAPVHTCYACGCIIDGEPVEIGGETFCADCADDWTVCDDCGRAIPCDDAIGTENGENICRDCFNDNYFICDECGDAIRMCDAIAVNPGYNGERYVCSYCAEHCCTRCDGCGEYYDDNYIELDDGDTHICRDCMDNWRTCDDCGRVTPCDYGTWDDSGDAWYCDDCYEQHHHNGVREYGYKPDPIFHSCDGERPGTRRYGVELEIDDGDDVDGFVDDAGDVDGLMYYKHDGSLGSNGVEIVSHPATLRYHLERMPWGCIADAARANGYTSHDAGTCGLHVHVGRREMCPDAPEKLLSLVDNMWAELVTFSRRRPADLSRWADRPDAGIVEFDDAPTAADKASKCRDKGRYQAVNLRNRATIEFRFIRGTLNPVSFRAALLLIDTICQYADMHTLSECARATWADIRNACGAADFIAYCEKRGI